jgi:DNA-binding transcriptional MerR regulator
MELLLTRNYTIAETCRILGIHRNTLLKYTGNGLIVYRLNAINGRKLYTGKEISRFMKLYR